MPAATNAFRSVATLGFFLVMVLGVLAACSAPPPPSMIETHAGQIKPLLNLAADAKQASDGRVPLLIVVTRHDCPYCLQLKRDILEPMLRSGDYRNRIIVRELAIDPAYLLKDFSGQAIISSDLAKRYKSEFTPTVLLLDDSGDEVADRLLGINTADLYGYYLDQAIDKALATMRGEPADAT